MSRSIKNFVGYFLRIDFSNINKIRNLKRELTNQMTAEVDDHIEMHEQVGEQAEIFCYYKEYEKKEHIARKLVILYDELIEDLINEAD